MLIGRVERKLCLHFASVDSWKWQGVEVEVDAIIETPKDSAATPHYPRDDHIPVCNKITSLTEGRNGAQA